MHKPIGMDFKDVRLDRFEYASRDEPSPQHHEAKSLPPSVKRRGQLMG